MINNLLTVCMMLGMLGLSMIMNTILGIATSETKFDKTKLGKGILKCFLVFVSVIGICFSLELAPLILLRVGLEIDADFITLTEIIVITFTAYKKYIFDAVEKFKKIIN